MGGLIVKRFITGEFSVLGVAIHRFGSPFQGTQILFLQQKGGD